MRRNILVAGGLGFIGTNLSLRLLEEGHAVYCIDNMCTSRAGNKQLLESHPNFNFILQDITFPIKLSIKLDEIYNLACPASPIHYQTRPIETIMCSVLGVRNLLEIAQANDCKILQASTSEVYGRPDRNPQIESYWGNVNPIGVRSCYDEGKRCAESLLMSYHKRYGTKIKIARIFNAYGPYMSSDDGRVIPNFIKQALTGKPLTVYGDGSQTRSLIYIDDLVEGLIRLMRTDVDITGPMNLGNPYESTISELASLVLKLTRSCSKITYHELPQDEPLVRCPDINLAHQVLGGWHPNVCLEDGLKSTITYFRNLVIFPKI